VVDNWGKVALGEDEGGGGAMRSGGGTLWLSPGRWRTCKIRMAAEGNEGLKLE